jgi:hypothetical protein
MRAKIVFFLVVAIITILVVVFAGSREGFGTSPGTMVQLQTSHVPTQEDYNFYTKQYPTLVRREVTDLTGEDPGVLRPWIFPWYGRGVSLIAQ